MKAGRGFTLLEMMVALTLFTLMSLAVVAAMRTFGNTRSTLDEVTGRVDEIRAVSSFLRDHVAAALPVERIGEFSYGPGASASYGTYFYGTEDDLLWVAPLVVGADLGGSYIMRLSRREDRLELRWHPYDRDAAVVDWAEIEPRVLLTGVEEFTVGYRAGYGGDWLSEWPGHQSLPVTVRLDIRARERYWPELVIALSGANLNLR